MLSAGTAGGGLRDPEALRDRYSRPYDARYPVICRDEHAKLLRADTRPAQPARPGRPATYDYAYVWCGTCTIGMFVEPLGPWRTVHATARRTAVDWAHPVKAIADHPRDREAARLIRVCAPLNTHAYASFFSGPFRPPRPRAGSGAPSWCLRPGTAAGSTGLNRN